MELPGCQYGRMHRPYLLETLPYPNRILISCGLGQVRITPAGVLIPEQEYPQLSNDELIHLYPIQTSYTGPQNWSNPVGEAHVNFSMKKAVSVKISVKNRSGIVIKEEMLQTEKGVNTFIWKYNGVSPDGRNRFFGYGDYQMNIEAAGNLVEGDLKVR